MEWLYKFIQLIYYLKLVGVLVAKGEQLGKFFLLVLWIGYLLQFIYALQSLSSVMDLNKLKIDINIFFCAGVGAVFDLHLLQ